MPATSTECPRCGRSIAVDAPEGLCVECLMKPDVAGGTDCPAGTVGPGASFDPPPIEELQQYLPNFRIVELIGRGGMGAVYLAEQRSLMRMVALKVLPPSVAQSPGFEARFAREARALAKLNHPGIVGIYDFGKAGPYAYLVMEYVDGVNLRSLIAEGHMRPEEALQVIPSLCDALQVAHSRGIVHRDIKPENILLTTDGLVKIADFGVAKMAENDEAQATRQGGIVGTFQYMAPEQLEQPGRVDHRADLYSLGVVFYEMLTGELPLGRFPIPSDHPGVDQRLDRVVLRALEKQPELRYGSAQDMKSRVETWDHEEAIAELQHAQRSEYVEAPYAKPSATAETVGYGLRQAAHPSKRHGWGGKLTSLIGIATRTFQKVAPIGLNLFRWVRGQLARVPRSLLFAGIALLFVLVGTVVMAESHREDEFMMAMCCLPIGYVLLRVAYLHVNTDSPGKAERALIIWPLGAISIACAMFLMLWPIAAGMGLTMLLSDFARDQGTVMTDSPSQLIALGFTVTTTLMGLNLAALAILSLFVPVAFEQLFKPLSIQRRVWPFLVLLGIGTTLLTIGGLRFFYWLDYIT